MGSRDSLIEEMKAMIQQNADRPANAADGGKGRTRTGQRVVDGLQDAVAGLQADPKALEADLQSRRDDSMLRQKLIALSGDLHNATAQQVARLKAIESGAEPLLTSDEGSWRSCASGSPP
jgi:hypothetical protein